MKFDISKIINIKEKNKKNIILGGLVLVIAVFITTDLLKLKLIEGQDNMHSLQDYDTDIDMDTIGTMLDSIQGIPDDIKNKAIKEFKDRISEREQKKCSESELMQWRNSCSTQRSAWKAIKDNGNPTSDDYYLARKNYLECSMGENYYKNFMIEGYYTLKAKKEVRRRKNEFDEEKSKVIQKRDYLDTINDYYNSLQGQPHRSISGDFKPDNVDMRQSYYEDEKVDELQWWSNLLTIVFFIIFVILAVYLLGFQKLYKDKKTWAILVVCVLYFFFFVNLLIPLMTAIKFVAIKVLPTDIYDKINID